MFFLIYVKITPVLPKRGAEMFGGDENRRTFAPSKDINTVLSDVVKRDLNERDAYLE